jgi:hypothetical protein
MTIKQRIAKIEKSKGKGRPLIAVHVEGQDFVTCEGREIPLAEWEQEYPDCTLLRVVYETKPVTNLAA